MEVTGFACTPETAEKQAAHRLTMPEVRSLLMVHAWVPYEHEGHPGQSRLVGRTMKGRLITVVVAPTPHPTVWRVITAWPASRTGWDYRLDEYTP